MAKVRLRSNRRTRWLFLSCVIILSAAAVATLVAVLLFAFDITDSTTAVVILCVAVAIAAVAALLSLIMSRVVLAPVARLSEASRQIARGDFDLNLTYDGAIEEYRDTYQSFNTMARELSTIETLRSDFIANVSHEFKTPLTTIEGYAMLLQDHELSAEERTDCVQRIMDSAGRLSALVSNMLMLSKLEQQTTAVEKAPFWLDEQIRQVLVGLEPLWGPKDLQLEVDLPPLKFNGSENLMYHVWSNLLSNAIKFSPGGAPLTVTLREQGGRVVFAVTDRGPGMTADVQRHIFDKFYQGDPSRKQEGTGLGLPLVKRIVQLCGGTVAVKSAPGQGSTFTVTLPKN
ncbi:MAG: HAMP domain-containing histidine kinase [Clostridia bacterium]|nr:HAMP domain-containing histidine kinase [Clostridia bacterium]